jgi:hypothetical protein
MSKMMPNDRTGCLTNMHDFFGRRASIACDYDPFPMEPFMLVRTPLILALALVASPVGAQDEAPLPPAGQLLSGASVFACAVEDRGEASVILLTFRRAPDRSVVLLTETGSLPAIEQGGRFVVLDAERMASVHIGNNRSGALVDGLFQPMACTEISYELRGMLRRLAE